MYEDNPQGQMLPITNLVPDAVPVTLPALKTFRRYRKAPEIAGDRTLSSPRRYSTYPKEKSWTEMLNVLNTGKEPETPDLAFRELWTWPPVLRLSVVRQYYFDSIGRIEPD